MSPRLVEDVISEDEDEEEEGAMNIEPISPTSLQLQLKSEFASYDSKEQHIYVNGNIKAPACANENRKPIDAVVVLDRSGSMRGQKLELCLKTIAFMIRELSSRDRLSIVSYDTTVRTDVPLTKMDQKGKAAIELALPLIIPGNCTNLSGGLLQGLQEIQSDKRNDGEPPNPVKSVMLLTDGMANHGITSTHALVQTVDGILRGDVSLFTFGYGAQHNETMLRQLSDAGRGVYYFVENINCVSIAFADALGGLLSVVAQNIKFECTTTGGCEVLSIKTRKKVNVIQEKIHHEVEVGDLYGDEERDFLLVLKISAAKEKGKVSLGVLSCTLTYADILQSSFIEQDSNLSIERFEDLPITRIPDSHVLRQKNRILTAEAMEKATTTANAGDLESSKAVLRRATEQVKQTLNGLSFDDKEQTMHLIEDLSDCQANLRSESAYLGGGRKKMYSATQSHYAQRSNDTPNALLASLAFDSASVSLDSRDSARIMTYRSVGKVNMMQKALNFREKS